ncbi:MAG TPA: type II secretion system F family protein [Bryobacteraceae bacterium]|nr:type II secretion system F family protein [Bryobacteraceae bacterium]
MFPFVAFLIFSAALFGTAWYVWAVPRSEEERVLEARLRGVRTAVRAGKDRGNADLVNRERRGSLAFVGDFVAWLGFVNRLQVFIQQANLPYRAADVVALSTGIAFVAWLILSFFVPVLLLHLGLALAVGALPFVFIMRKRASRLSKFEDQLPDAIDLFTRTMRAGHNIHSGLETIGEETSDPVRMEFRKVTEELALGSAIEPALHKLGDRVPLVDLKFFITGLILQRQTGANMVAVLENLSALIRERLNMARKLKAHTASQRFSAGLLCALPFVVGLGFWVQKPEYVRMLWTDPLGTKFLTYAIVSETIGILIIRKIANVKV